MEIIRQRHELTTFTWGKATDFLQLVRRIRQHDVAFSWFLGHHSAATGAAGLITGVPNITIAGGEEVTPPSQLGSPPWSMKDRMALEFSYNRSRMVLAVSRATLAEAAALRKRWQTSEVRCVPNGIDTDRFRPSGRKEDVAVSAAYIDSASLKRKRLRLVIQSARLLPDIQFVLPGRDTDGSGKKLLAESPSNVSFPGELPRQEYASLLQRAKVSIQVSTHEAFGVANAEAMACGCVPVVTPAGALPEVVGDSGIYVSQPEPATLAQAINHAIDSDLGKRAAERINRLFSLKAREVSLLRAIDDCQKTR